MKKSKGSANEGQDEKKEETLEKPQPTREVQKMGERRNEKEECEYEKNK